VVAENYDPNEEDMILSIAPVNPDLTLSVKLPIRMPGHRNLLAAGQVGPALGLASSTMNRDLLFGTAFMGSSTRGTQRVTVVQSDGKALDGQMKPLTPIEYIGQMTGVFGGDGKFGAFAMTAYNVIFTDFISGESTSATRRRYSYFPSFISSRSFFPIVVQGFDGEFVPALWASPTLSALNTLEVLIPHYSKDGKLLGMISPALFRIDAGEGCRLMGNPIAAHEGEPAKAAMFCGDRMKFFELSLK
jgi:hypothetical protein